MTQSQTCDRDEQRNIYRMGILRVISRLYHPTSDFPPSLQSPAHYPSSPTSARPLDVVPAAMHRSLHRSLKRQAYQHWIIESGGSCSIAHSCSPDLPTRFLDLSLFDTCTTCQDRQKLSFEGCCHTLLTRAAARDNRASV